MEEVESKRKNVLRDMTVGSSFSILWRFALPMLLSMFFQQLYNIADSLIAGKFAGVNALAAVGASYPVTMLFLAVATGAANGCSVIVSQVFGSKDFRTLRSTISTAMITSGILSLVLTVVGLVVCRPIIALLGTPKEIFDDSALYLYVYIGGFFFLFMYNAATAIFNGLGNSKIPLYFLIFSSVFNIILDYVFVRYFHMGVGGVAWATFIAQGISSLLAMGTLFRKIRTIKVDGTYEKFNVDILKSISRIAIPSICQQSFISVGQLMVQGLINSYGAEVVAGYSAAFKVHNFSLMTMATMSAALSSYAAQNIGAGELKRAKRGFRATLIMIEAIMAVICVIVVVFASHIIAAFVPKGSGENVIQVGKTLLWTLVPFYPLVALKNSCDGILRGAGDMKRFMVTTFGDLALRVIFSYIFSALWGYTGIWWSYPLGWVIGTALSFIFYQGGWWKNMHLTI